MRFNPDNIEQQIQLKEFEIRICNQCMPPGRHSKPHMDRLRDELKALHADRTKQQKRK